MLTGVLLLVLVGAGAWITLHGAWRAAADADITAAVAALVRRQAGLMVENCTYG